MTQPQETTPDTPYVGMPIHYVSYGTPNGEYQSQCRAAVVTEVAGKQPASAQTIVSVAVMNPTGMFFNENLPMRGSCSEPTPGTCHPIGH